MMKRLAFLVLLFSALIPAALHAQTCSGSSPTWSCTATATSAIVNATIAAASDGDTINFATGTYTFSAPMPFSLTKGLAIICTGTCTITSPAPSYTFGIATWTGSGQFFTKPYRVSGFTWSAPMPASGCLVEWGSNPTSVNEGVFTNIRIDHNSASPDSTVVDPNMVCFQSSGHRSYFYGVVDHNTFTCARSCRISNGQGATIDPFPPPNPLGTLNNLFFEDNTITINPMTNNGTGCIDNGGTAPFPWVIRNNSSTDCLWTGHYTPLNYEFYNNSVTIDTNANNNHDCYRCFHSQANSSGMYFHNTFTSNLAPNSDVLEVQSAIRDGYKVDPRKYPYTLKCTGFVNFPPVADTNRATSQANQGYPCSHQVARDQATGAFVPFYAWGNTKNGSLAKLFISDPGNGQNPDFVHAIINREYYTTQSATAQSSPTSPWDCASGTDMGFGPLANQPTDCAAYTGEAGGGLGYAAETVVGTIGASVGAGTATDAVLYNFGASGWTQIYKPAPYPHPYVAGTAITAFPTTNVAPGPYLTTQSVTISDSSPSPTLYCTQDGSAPTHSSPSFSSPHTFTISTTETLNCLAASAGLLDSLTLSAPYLINLTSYLPEFDKPPGGFPAGTLTLTLSNNQLLVRNCITDDGSTPTSSGLNDGNCGHTHITSGVANGINQFSTVNISATTTIKALTTGVNYVDSPVVAATYTIGAGTNGLWWEDLGGPNFTINGTASAENFGNQIVGTTSGQLPIFLNNPGSTSTTITSAVIAGTGFARAAGDGCGAVSIVITAGNWCSFGVTFTPTGTGVSNGTLTLTDNAPGSPHVINLQGTGVNGAVTTTPAPLNPVMVGSAKCSTCPPPAINETKLCVCADGVVVSLKGSPYAPLVTSVNGKTGAVSLSVQ